MRNLGFLKEIMLAQQCISIKSLLSFPLITLALIFSPVIGPIPNLARTHLI
jgi:hypothetical protein